MIHDRRARARNSGQIRVSRGGRAADEHLKVGFFGYGMLGFWIDCFPDLELSSVGRK